MKKIFILFFCLLFANASLADSNELSITNIIPSGDEVPSGRQIVIQFNQPVVPIGKMERAKEDIPVQINPELNCQWRWLNTSALSCNLNEQDSFQEATKYEITINPGIKTEDGKTLKAPYKHEFTTELPKAYYAYVREWNGPTDPVIRVSFNQPVSKSSVEKSIYMTAGKLAYQIKAFPDETFLEKPRYVSVERNVIDFGTQTLVKSQDDKVETAGEEARSVWLVSAKEPLPLDTETYLKIKPGLVSANGNLKGNEERDILYFKTYPEFRFLGFKCLVGGNYETFDNKASILKKCSPEASFGLLFSSPVLEANLNRYISVNPKEEFSSSYSTTESIWLSDLKPNTRYNIKSQKLNAFEVLRELFKSHKFLSLELRDTFGRPLQNEIDISFATDHLKPDFELGYNIAVLEKNIDSAVPLYITNIEKLKIDYRKITSEGFQFGTKDIDFPKVQDKTVSSPLGIRKILGGKTGIVYGKVGSGQISNNASPLFAQVTPYQIHAKIGHHNTMVWVTELGNGKPLKDATITIHKGDITNDHKNSELLKESKTNGQGIAFFQGKIDYEECYYTNLDECEEILFIKAQKNGDIAVLPINYNFKVYSYDVSNGTVHSMREQEYGYIDAWGATAQGVYRAGDTMQYKIYVRNEDNTSITQAPKGKYKLEIIDPTGKTVEEVKEIELSEFGSFSGEYKIPENGAVGWYEFKLTADFTDYGWYPMKVLVSDFTPSPFKVVNSVNGEIFKPKDEIEIITEAKLHSGGAYTDADARVTVTLKPKYFSSNHPIANDFTFDSYNNNYNAAQLFQKIENVGDDGKLTHQLTIPEEDIVYGQLAVESAVMDDRGKYIADSSSADYISVDKLVGLKNTKWFYEQGKPSQIKYIVVDEKGVPVSDVEVNIEIERLETKVSKVKGAGNTYLSNYVEEWIKESSCEGVSKESAGTCKFTPQNAGTYRFTAKITDGNENIHTTAIDAWVIGSGYVVWNDNDNNALQVIPEKHSYNIGDKARYIIKNPYPNAKALISIERYGIIKHWITEFKNSTEVLEFEIEKDFMPGFYLSVLVFSPRAEEPPTELGVIDMGKPSFKMGYVKVPVNDPYKQLDISVKTDKEVYKPREKVKLNINAEPKHKDKNEPIELAVIVLDEAVLDLVQGGKSYFDIYRGFYNLEWLNVMNYSLVKRLIGKQNFRKKGANAGGDGGGGDVNIRSLFKFVSYWNPSVIVDNKGNAEIEFEVPDNLTGWRVLVIGATPTDRMGLGDVNFKVNLPTEVRPVMPNQVLSGDEFKAGFSVMNRTDKERELNIKIDISGNVEDEASFHKKITLSPYKRQTVLVPVKAKGEGKISFTAKAYDNIDSDGIEHSLPVNKRRSLDTSANYGSTTGNKVTENILLPENIHGDAGEIAVTLSPSVIGNIAGAFKYMKEYPYTCWEQKLTKGVMASHYQNLKSYIPNEFSWKESETLTDEILKLAPDYQAPNGGMAYFIADDRYVSPYLSAYTALAFNWLKTRGHEVSATVEENLHEYLLNLLRKDDVPDFYSQGMTSTVRAVALNALATNGKITIEDLERYRPHFEYMSLFGKSNYLQALLQVEGTNEIVQEVQNNILARSSQSGGKFSFNEALDDSYARILATPLRSNCSILSSLVKQKETAGDTPFKLVRFITASRGNRNHWENTQENIFCMNALVDYAKAYENVKPDMSVNVDIDGKNIGSAEFKAVSDEAKTISRDIVKEDVGRKLTVNIVKTDYGCEASGGKWQDFPNTCVGNCQIRRNPDDTVCGSAITKGCECGEGRCWDSLQNRCVHITPDDLADEQDGKLGITEENGARLYYTTRISYAPLDEYAERTNAGIDIRKEYSVERNGKWIMLENPMEIKRGELVRVDIYLSLPTARNFVVVDDPVPGGLEPVNRDLATASIVDAAKGETAMAGGSWWFNFSDWISYNASRWSFYHKELRHDAVKFYSDYLPAGNYHLSYTAQAIAEGKFSSMPVFSEEMYDPDVYGKGLPRELRVGE